MRDYLHTKNPPTLILHPNAPVTSSLERHCTKGCSPTKTSEATPILRTASRMTAFDIATGDITRASTVSRECQRKNSSWALLHPYATPAH